MDILTKITSFQATKSRAGKIRSYNFQKKSSEWNNVAYELKKKRVTISHNQHWAPPIPTLISTKEKELRHENKGVPHRKQEIKKEAN